MNTAQSLDPHERPPESIRNVYKKYQKMKPKELEHDANLLTNDNTSNLNSNSIPYRMVETIESSQSSAAFAAFEGTDGNQERKYASTPAYDHVDMPGLLYIPDLLPPVIQILLLDRLLHRDLSNPAHLTNIHTHYDLTYPHSSSSSTSSSFFSLPPTSSTPIATPLDPYIHKPLTISQLLNRKMRWMTLGGQYDWTAKKYPQSPPPAFPSDVAALLEGLFPSTKAEAAIVNLYSPGDTLSVHRDVAEECGKGLISVSLGCDAIFVIGTRIAGGEGEKGEEKIVTLRLKSGSAVYMSGESRFAWHGVPRIVAGSCPEHLREWPACKDGEYEEWRNWMAGKRVNLNVRQMWDF